MNDSGPTAFLFTIFIGMIAIVTTAMYTDVSVYPWHVRYAEEKCKLNGGLKHIRMDAMSNNTTTCNDEAVFYYNMDDLPLTP